jgi:hypothetical protein
MNREQLRAIGYEVNSGSLKSLKIRMRKTLEMKLKGNEYFNPNYKIPDRILSST